jgi:hypothetical protein
MNLFQAHLARFYYGLSAVGHLQTKRNNVFRKPPLGSPQPGVKGHEH